ncbi:pro-resilin-like [Macrobrachium rosenbergii]|uniref:pro-resilin-like n=1 Tax=Macrobrachium rosenbergii TaxID=79674 RepID=UPI0034D39749
MNAKVVFLLGLAAVVASDKRPRLPSTSYGVPQVSRYRNSDESFEPARYNFQFGVHDDSTGASFEHQESRDVDKTQGSYIVQLPDSRLQTVKYFVNGGSGYVADVTYDGEARYPDSSSSFESREFSGRRPSFSAPRAHRPRAQRPRPTFTSFDSRESREFFSAPSTSYGVPL